MSDFNQNLGLNYHNFQNYQNNQENQCPPLSQDNENDLPTEESKLHPSKARGIWSSI